MDDNLARMIRNINVMDREVSDEAKIVLRNTFKSFLKTITLVAVPKK